MTDLINLFRNTVSETLTYQASEMLGESLESTSSAVSSIFPALLGTVILKGRTDPGAREILDYMRGNNIDGSVLQDLPTLLNGGPEVEILKANGADILKFLIDDKVSPLVDTVASNNGLRTSSASSLLKIVATLLLTAISKVASEKNLNAAGLRDLLDSQTDSVRSNTPDNLATLLGLHSSSRSERSVHGPIITPPHEPDRGEGTLMSKLLPWIVLLIAALGLFYFLDKGTKTPPVETPVMNTDSINNARRLDSLRMQREADSLSNTGNIDTVKVQPGDSLR